MKPIHSSGLHVIFILFVGASLQLTKGSLDAAQKLEKVIEQAERESKILADEINQWLIQQSGDLVNGDVQVHHRSRRSADEDDEEERTETNLLSDVNRQIVRRDVSKDKESHKGSEIKGKDKESSVESHHRIIQSEKRHVQKETAKKLAKEKAKDKKVSKGLKSKRVLKQKDKKAKHKKKNNDEVSKANLVRALIEGGDGSKSHKEPAGVPEKAYRQLVEFMAGAEQETIETRGSKKSDIAMPSSNHKGGKSSKKNKLVHRTLTKKHKRVLAILSKMPRNVLRKYFHLKGLDKYWKVMDNIRRKKAAKLNGGKKIKAHKDEKIVKQVKGIAPKKAKTTSAIKHSEEIRLLQKQDKPHQKDSKQIVSQHKIVKENTEKKIVEDKTAKKSQPALQSTSSKKVIVEQHAKEDVKPQKDLPKKPPKGTKSTAVVKVDEKSQKNDAGKSLQISKAALHVKNSTSSSKTPENTKSAEVKDMSKQKPVAGTQKALPKDSKDKALNTKEQHTPVGKVMTVNASQTKSPASLQSTKTTVKLQTVKDQNRAKQKSGENDEPLKEQLKAMAPKAQHKIKNKESSTEVHDKPKEIPKALKVTEHNDVKTAHALQKAADKHSESSQAKQNSAPNKIDILKEKIQKTNNLKFKVAQALLAHCETQNRLRQVFDEVNTSLKKAAILAKAIGAKFGIKPTDVEKMTSEHTEGAVEQFLNKLF